MRRLLSIVFAFLLAAACFAQEAEEPEKSRRRLLVAFEARSESGFEASQAAVLARSLELSIRNAVPGMRIIDYGPSAFPSSLETRNAEALRLGADCWLWVSISGDLRAPTLRAQSYDLVAQTISFDKTFARTEEIVLLDASRERWEEIVSLVAETYRTAPSELPKNERRTVTLTIHALPDTSITGLPGGPIAASRYGVATARLDAPSSYRLRASLEGYYPVRQEVYVDADGEVQIEQKPASAWSAEASFFNAFFLDGEAGYFFLPNRAFLKVGVTSFLIGLSMSRESLFYSFPLLHLNIQLGRYWLPEDAGMRWYSTVGMFTRIVFVPGFPPRVDALSPVGFQLGLGTEIPIAGRSRFFFEYIPMLYLSTYADLFLMSFASKGVPFGYVPLPIGALNFMNARFGVRWML